MPVRTSDAVWMGGLKAGRGTVRVGSAFAGEYSFASRFETGKGTNPEELIAAAHAGCFSMALSAELEGAGYPPTSVRTQAHVHLDKGDAGFGITLIELATRAIVPGITDELFQQRAQAAKTGCPVSRALAAVDIALSATLENG